MDSELERISSDEETDTILREFIASARISRREPLWTFCALDCTDPAIQSHIHTLKDYWRPHGDRLEIPEEWSHLILPPVENPSFRGRMPCWFDLSLLSAALSSISSDLCLVSTPDLIARFETPNYWGPRFPLGGPPDSDSNIRAIFDLLVCDGSSAEAFVCVASCFVNSSGCQLKIHPQTLFPVQLCAEPPKVDFACAPEWNSTSRCMLSRARNAPLRLSSPALTIGILQGETGQTDDVLSPDELACIAQVAQPHLEALLIAWDQRYPKLAPDPAVCIFALALRAAHVFIVAHTPYPAESEYHYRSIVVDQIPFPRYIPGTQDRKGLLARLRLAISLLTIQNHTSRAASLCQDVVWPANIVDRELALVRECTGIVTPSPSEHGNPDAEFWGPLIEDAWLAGGEEVAEVAASSSDIARSKARVTDWLRHQGAIS